MCHGEHQHPEDTTGAITLNSWHLSDKETDSEITRSTERCEVQISLLKGSFKVAEPKQQAC